MFLDKSLLAYSKTKYGQIAYLKNDVYIASFYQNGIVPFQNIVENNLIKYILNSKVVIDCGAHIGNHSIIYKHFNPNLEIYAFEPHTIMYEIFKLNISSLNLKSVNLYNCAVGNRFGNISISDRISDGPNANEIINYNNLHNFGGIQIAKNGIEDKVIIPIDYLNLSRCDFIKIDVEGFEFPVILGAINTIMKYKPVIFYEYNVKNMTDDMSEISGIPKDDGNAIFTILHSIGYVFHKIGDLDILAIPS